MSEAVQIVADTMHHNSFEMGDAEEAVTNLRAALDAGNEDVAEALGLRVECEWCDFGGSCAGPVAHPTDAAKRFVGQWQEES